MPRGVVWLGGLALVVGCLDPLATRCADGRGCAPGMVCVDALELCVAPDQLAACAQASDGDECSAAGIPVGTCTNGACLKSGCGNGLVESGEACDDGNLRSGDGCSADCSSNETCGNKVTDPGEQCDCGTAGDVRPGCPGPNSVDSGLCGSDCTLRCGDGVISPDEGCDPAAAATVSCAGVTFDRGLTTCSASCQPVITADTCRYIGWRTRAKNNATNPTRAVSATGPTRGYFISNNIVDTYVDFAGINQPFAFSRALRALWVLDDDTAFVVGDAGTIGHRASPTWVARPSGTTVDLVDVWGRASNDVYALGDALVLRWDGSTWSPLPPPPTGGLHRIAGTADRLYVAGDAGALHVFDGGAWQTIATGTVEDLRSVWADGSFVVAVGDAGTILQNDGAGWVRGRATTTADLFGVAGNAARGFFISGGRGTLLGYDGHVWRPLALGRGVTGSPDQMFYAVGVSRFGVGAIGTEDLIVYEGAAWSPTVSPTAQTLHALWGSATDDVFAVGRNGTILHHDGLTWTIQPAGTNVDLRAVWGTGPTDVYAAGDRATLLHYDGVAWSTLSTGTGSFSAVLSTAPGDVVVAGTLGTTAGIYRYAGNMFLLESSALARALWGIAPSKLFAAGGGIHAFDGSGWGVVQTPASVAAIAGSSATDVYAVGTTAYHYDGTSWQPGPFHEQGLGAVCARPDGAFAVGATGKLRYWNRSALEPFVSRTTLDLTAVFEIGDVVFMAGVDGTLDVMVFAD